MGGASRPIGAFGFGFCFFGVGGGECDERQSRGRAPPPSALAVAPASCDRLPSPSVVGCVPPPRGLRPLHSVGVNRHPHTPRHSGSALARSASVQPSLLGRRGLRPVTRSGSQHKTRWQPSTRVRLRAARPLPVRAKNLKT